MEIKITGEDKQKKLDKWEIEDAFNTLMRAEKIKKDALLMKAVSDHAKEQKKAIDSVAGLRELYNKKVAPHVSKEPQMERTPDELALEKQIQDE